MPHDHKGHELSPVGVTQTSFQLLDKQPNLSLAWQGFQKRIRQLADAEPMNL